MRWYDECKKRGGKERWACLLVDSRQHAFLCLSVIKADLSLIALLFSPLQVLYDLTEREQHILDVCESQPYVARSRSAL